MKRGLLSALVLSAGLVFAAPAVALADGIEINGAQAESGNIVVDNESSTITVSGNVTLDGAGDAFTINADTSLVFEEGASLTLTGYATPS